MRRTNRNHAKLYQIAKDVTLEAGFDYTDPRTGVTTKAPRAKLARNGAARRRHANFKMK